MHLLEELIHTALIDWFDEKVSTEVLSANSSFGLLSTIHIRRSDLIWLRRRDPYSQKRSQAHILATSPYQSSTMIDSMREGKIDERKECTKEYSQFQPLLMRYWAIGVRKSVWSIGFEVDPWAWKTRRLRKDELSRAFLRSGFRPLLK